MQVFLVVSTCLLYLVAAGLFSRAVGYFEQQEWNSIIGGDAQELGDGAGTYDIDKVVWHVNVSSHHKQHCASRTSSRPRKANRSSLRIVLQP